MSNETELSEQWHGWHTINVSRTVPDGFNVGAMKYNDSGFVKLYYIPFDRCKKSQMNKSFRIWHLPVDDWKIPEDKRLASHKKSTYN